MPTIQDKIRLAREFGHLIQGELNRVDFTAACDLNKGEPEGSLVCHSHDFCDANMVMLAAFQDLMKRDPAFLLDNNQALSTADLELWNDAWAIASAASFFA